MMMTGEKDRNAFIFEAIINLSSENTRWTSSFSICERSWPRRYWAL